MTEFTELDIEKDIDNMEESELRKTLSDFMEQHETNIEVYDGLKVEYEDELDEKEDTIEGLRERVSAFKQERAEEAAEYVKMPADVLAGRFDFSELDQIIEEAEESDEFSEDDDEDEEESDYLTDFAEQPQKGRQESRERSQKHRDRAARALENKNFPVSE